MNHEPRNRQRSRWIPEMEPDRRSLQTLFAFAYGMQVGRMRRIAVELQKLAQQAQLATMASGAAIAIAAQNQIECIARSGDAAPQLGSKPEATVGLSGECIRTGIPQFCADTETHPFVDRMHSRTFGVRSIVYIPLFRGLQPAGVIGVFSDKPGHFTQHDMRVLQLIGREVTKLLKWEPNPNASFAPVSAPVTSPDPSASAAAPTIVQSEATLTEPEHAFEEIKVVDADVVAEPLEISGDDQLETSETPLASQEPLDVESGEVTAEFAEFISSPDEESTDADPKKLDEWVGSAEIEYPASVPSFLLSEERRIPRWIFILGVLATIAVVFGAVWHYMPLWAPTNQPPQMVYGPPQVTRDTDTAPPQSSEIAPPVSTVPGVPTVSTPEQSVKTPGSPMTYVKTVQTQASGNHTFVSIYLSGPAQFQAHELTNPDRIYIDLHGVEISPDLKNVKIAGVGPVADFRFSKSENNIARLVMVLDAPCTYLVSVTSDPYVIVLDVQPLRMPRPGAPKQKVANDSVR
jgi:hypothetical protein